MTANSLNAFTQVSTTSDRSSSCGCYRSDDAIRSLDPGTNGEVPSIAITPAKAVHEMIIKLDNGENRVGKVKILYAFSRIAPAFAFRILDQLSQRSTTTRNL